MFTIRRATAEDIDDVVNLRIAFLREVQSDAGEPGRAIIDLTRQYVMDKLPGDEFLVWFAEECGHIIGISGLLFFQRPPTFQNISTLYAYIINVYTMPEWRGNGVATALVEHIIEYVKSTPAKRISLHASEMARSVYERLGFVASFDEMVYNLEE